MQAWDELRLWLDLPRHPDFRGFLAVDIARPLGGGLTFRPLEQTVADTLAWALDRDPAASTAEGAPLPPRIMLTRRRESELLDRLAT